MYRVSYKGINYFIYPSKKEYKKYDVFLSDDSYLLSFGDKRYEQFKDKLGYYKKLDHNDEKRRELYKNRHKNDYIDNPNYAGFWAWHYLW